MTEINNTKKIRSMTRQLKIFLKTFGCQMNLYDSEVMKGILVKAGYVVSVDMELADVILINTCSVRKHAEDRVYNVVENLKVLKRGKPDLIIGICGCMAQKEKEKLFERLPHLDLVLGTDEIDRVAEVLREVAERKKGGRDAKCCVSDVRDWNVPGINPETLEKNSVTAFITVMRGCDKFCSYCVVPYLRGREKSRAMQGIIEEVEGLVKKGVKEITFLGQNILNYGKDIRLISPSPEPSSQTLTLTLSQREREKKGREREKGEGGTLLKLLEEVSKIEGLLRIRFITSHPADLTEEFLEGMSKLPKVCKYLHLPVQSGADRILKAMNRPYVISYYEDLIKYARKLMPDIGLSTDIIVGFPGEKDEDYKETLRIVKEIRFDNIFMFNYSPRKGTAACKLDDDVPALVKTERLDTLIKIQNKISEDVNKELIGKTVEVLVEKRNDKNKDELIGKTEQNKTVIFKGEGSLAGTIVKVKINKATQATMKGEI